MGFKAPGWFLEWSAYGVLERYFRYVADHVIGTQVTRFEGSSLLRFPYLYTIDQMGPWPDTGLVVLQSHIAADGSITNGWCRWLEGRVRAFIGTGLRLGAELVTLGEFAGQVSACRQPGPAEEKRVDCRVVDRRLHGGHVRRCGPEVGVLYNGAGEPCPYGLAPDNAAVAVLSRNRRDYLADLLESVDQTGPKELVRLVLLNNCEDGSASLVRREFPNWNVIEFDDVDHPEEPPGLRWLKSRMPHLLPLSCDELGPEQGWTATRSIGWLSNQQFLCTDRDFIVWFDDDFLVKPGWWEYYVRFQQECGAHAVFNNFGAYVMCRSVVARIGWFDERFLGSHGFEDNDYAIRLAEGNVRWVLGFNTQHDWRSAEEGNPRGSMTGADYFVHRYAFGTGGFAARREEARLDPVRAAWNDRWFHAEWEETEQETGLLARPPFVGTFYRRKVGAEPDWHPGRAVL
ncbi:MAG: glycosyltransferase family A protein [Candidatus Brocadiia bacterium]